MLQVTERCMIVNMVLTTHHARFASLTVLVTAILMQVRVFRQAQSHAVAVAAPPLRAWHHHSTTGT